MAEVTELGELMNLACQTAFDIIRWRHSQCYLLQSLLNCITMLNMWDVAFNINQDKNMYQNMKFYTIYILIKNKTPEEKTNGKAGVGSSTIGITP